MGHNLTGADVHQVLAQHGIAHLHHANTVTTSCAFLRLKGLASRKRVEDAGLPQTAQFTDPVDKKYGIYNDIFTDGVDIHKRAGRKKGPNQYGPVLFRLPVAVLLNLPAGAEVMVARLNPSKWSPMDAPDARFFQDEEQLRTGYKKGEFDQHIIIRTPTGILPFSDQPVDILVDDPQLSLPDGTNAHVAASNRLKAAAVAGGVEIRWTTRECGPGCVCLEKYRTWDLQKHF